MSPVHHLLSVVLLLLLSTAPLVTPRGIPNVFRKETMVNKGLYIDAPHVKSMNGESLPSTIYDKPYATYLEFYNSYCGFCRRFAPSWKELSQDIKHWRDVVQVGAVDCSLDENGDVCRVFEVTSYPSIRYIPPMYAAMAKDEGNKPQIGSFVGSADHSAMKGLLIQYLANETNAQPHWPNFKPLSGTQASTVLDEAVVPGTVVGFVFVQDDTVKPNTTVAEIMLDLHKTSERAVFRRTSEPLPWMPSNLEHSAKPWLFVVTAEETSGNVLETLSSSAAITKQMIVEKVMENLKRLNLAGNEEIQKEKDNKEEAVVEEPEKKSPSGAVPDEPNISDVMAAEQQKSIIEKVKTMKDVVFRADLDMALRFALFHEVANHEDISGERLAALKQFVAVVARYFPFGGNGQRFIKDLQEYVMTREEAVSGKDFSVELKRLEAVHTPVFSSSRWVGCASASDAKRRFPCSLWTMFHHLTVAADEQEKSTDPLEVLHAMHGYIKHFFGCTDCSQHFQQMAVKNKMWSITSKDMAILWLWSAHNEVNQRLSGDETEDPEFPKVQFPSRDVCPKCYKAAGSGSGNQNGSRGGSAEWDKTEVQFFLKRMHNVRNISIFGVDNEMALPGVAERLMMARGEEGGKVGRGLFDDHDFRLGLVLYGCSIALIIVAVKMFVKRRGCFYRKKLYVHDMLGKV